MSLSEYRELLLKEDANPTDWARLALLLESNPRLVEHRFDDLLSEDEVYNLPPLALTKNTGTTYLLLSYGANPNSRVIYTSDEATDSMSLLDYQMNEPGKIPLLIAFGLRITKAEDNEQSVRYISTGGVVSMYLIQHAIISEALSEESLMSFSPRQLIQQVTLNERSYGLWLEILQRGFDPSQPELGELVRAKLLQEQDPSTLFLMIAYGLDIDVKERGMFFLEELLHRASLISSAPTPILVLTRFWQRVKKGGEVGDAYSYDLPSLLLMQKYGKLPSDFSWKRKYEKDFGAVTTPITMSQYRYRAQMPTLVHGNQSYPLISTAFGEGFTYTSWIEPKVSAVLETYRMKLMGVTVPEYDSQTYLRILYGASQERDVTWVQEGQMPTRKYFIESDKQKLQFDDLDFLRGMLFALKLAGVDPKSKLGPLHRLVLS